MQMRNSIRLMAKRSEVLRMKLKLRRLVESFNDDSLSRLVNDKHLPIQTAFDLKPIYRQAETHVKDFTEERDKRVAKYKGEVDEENRRYRFATDEIEKVFTDEINLLLDKEIEITGNRLTIKSFKPRAVTADPFLSIADFISLSWLIDSGDDE